MAGTFGIATQGHQLTELKKISASNLQEAVDSNLAVLITDVTFPGGESLPQFRDLMRANFAAIGGKLAITPDEIIDDGDMIWRVREKLNTNWAQISAVP